MPLAKDRVTTHHYNLSAPKIEGAHLRTETRPFALALSKSVGVREGGVEGMSVKIAGAALSADLGGSRYDSSWKLEG